jgi:hypothetical protein
VNRMRLLVFRLMCGGIDLDMEYRYWSFIEAHPAVLSIRRLRPWMC